MKKWFVTLFFFASVWGSAYLAHIIPDTSWMIIPFCITAFGICGGALFYSIYLVVNESDSKKAHPESTDK
jgi:hypothetical protein